jgi:hypothetical protein
MPPAIFFNRLPRSSRFSFGHPAAISPRHAKSPSALQILGPKASHLGPFRTEKLVQNRPDLRRETIRQLLD